VKQKQPKPKKIKKPSFLRTVIKDSWEILREAAHYRRSVRILTKQEWSFEFIVHLLKRADSGISIKIQNGPHTLILTKDTIVQNPEKGSDITERDLMDYLGIVDSRGE